jgi:hypothetical protein
MAKVNPKRMTARMDGEFVVFLIGMRINRWWRIDQWLPVALAMPRMIRELQARPELGLLGTTYAGFSNPTVLIQYWKSSEALFAYATSKDSKHLPAWIDFRKKAAKNGAVGVWHETYVIDRGKHESVYVNMPPFGLGAVGELVPAEGHYAHASARLREDGHRAVVANGGREPRPTVDRASAAP